MNQLDMFYPVFTVFAGIAVIIALVPLPWHFNAWNSGTCYYMIWAALASLNMFVNSIVWHNNALNPSPIWCDISTRIVVGSSVGIPAAALCITRRLYSVAKVQATPVTTDNKRSAILFDTLLCVFLPILEIVLYYIVQGHRYDVFESMGCYPTVVNSWLCIVLVQAWPIVIGIISAVYCTLSLRAFLRRQASLKEFLSSNQSMSPSRYVRLMALACTEIICTIPLYSYTIYFNCQNGVPSYGTWADVHWGFSRVRQIPALLWQLNPEAIIAMELTRWSPVACAYIFFIYFGFVGEARKHYKLVYWTIAKWFGVQPSSGRNGNAGAVVGCNGLPIYVPPAPHTRKRMDSIASSHTIDALACSPPSSSAALNLTIDTEKSTRAGSLASFSPTVDELVMITHMLRISEPPRPEGVAA